MSLHNIGRSEFENMVECKCDFCGKKETHNSDVSTVSLRQRKRGWITVPGLRMSDPSKWSCPGCKVKSNV